jgi:hypothetical protein
VVVAIGLVSPACRAVDGTAEYVDGCVSDDQTLAGIATKFKLNGGEWRGDPVTGGYIYFVLDVDAFTAGRN